MTSQHRISRRALLRSALLGSSAFAAAALVGCGGKGTGSRGERTPTPVPTLVTPRWGRLPDVGVLPPPRRNHSLVIDGRRLYLFGGQDASPLSDFWVHDLAAGQWTAVAASGPSARFGHNAGYDPVTSRLLVFGGQSNGFLNDVWAYAPTSGTWQQVTAAGPPASRYGAASALDPAGRLIVSHGFTDTGRFDDTWALATPHRDAWSEISPSGGRPLERCLTRGVWDPTAARFLMFGGQTDSAPFLGDTWLLTQTGWLEITDDRPPSPRNLFSMVWDDERARALLFGGLTEDGPTNDLWIFDGTSNAWSRMGTQGEAPTPRIGHDAVWLPGRRSMIVFGGEDAGGPRNDLWELAFSG